MDFGFAGMLVGTMGGTRAVGHDGPDSSDGARLVRISLGVSIIIMENASKQNYRRLD